MKPFMQLFAVLTSLTLFSGCVALVAAGGAAGTVAYVRGELHANLEADVPTLNDAVVEAARKLELAKISEDADKISGKFVYRNAKDTKITIKTEESTDTITELKIRVGWFGDENMSRRILNRIEKNL